MLQVAKLVEEGGKEGGGEGPRGHKQGQGVG